MGFSPGFSCSVAHWRRERPRSARGSDPAETFPSQGLARRSRNRRAPWVHRSRRNRGRIRSTWIGCDCTVLHARSPVGLLGAIVPLMRALVGPLIRIETRRGPVAPLITALVTALVIILKTSLVSALRSTLIPALMPALIPALIASLVRRQGRTGRVRATHAEGVRGESEGGRVGPPTPPQSPVAQQSKAQAQDPPAVARSETAVSEISQSSLRHLFFLHDFI